MAQKIGQIIVDAGLVTERDVAFALSEKQRNEYLIQALVRLGILSHDQEQAAWDLLAYQINLPHWVPGRDFKWQPDMSSYFDATAAHTYKALPLIFKQGFLWVGMTNPLDLKSLEAIRILTGTKVRNVLIAPDNFIKGISTLYSEFVEPEGEIEINLRDLADLEEEQQIETATPVDADTDSAFSDISRMETIELEEDDSKLSAIIRLFRSILRRSILSRASDIHIEPSRNDAVIRFRIDGALHQITEVHAERVMALIAAIKVQCEMDISEKRLPQDGRFSAFLGGQEIDFRVSTLPTVFGEKIVLRLLRRGTGLLRLDRLGLDTRAEEAVLRAISANSGIVLITGPTGSGKSTTLYSVLRELDLGHLNVITIEDPVEYQMTGISQVNVRSDIGLTFASILRTVLRQDPDVVMLGEIRDTETAEMAIRAALTGHIVLSTLHTNSAPATIDRLLDMGIPPYLLGSAIRFIGAQRLVRKVCTRCAESYRPDENLLALFHRLDLKDFDFKKGKGCEVCSNTGYHGRMALLEFVEIRGRIIRLISRGEDSAKIKESALEDGLYYNIVEPGLRAVKEGRTTLEELSRVLTDI